MSRGETGASDFPVTENAYSRNIKGGYDLFVSKFNPEGSALLFSTLIGGTDDDYSTGIAIDKSDNAYITGYTDSANFPVTVGAFQTNCGGDTDIFITKLDKSGSSLIYSTYLGGSELDSSAGIAIDNFDNAYVAGWTYSNFPITSNAFYDKRTVHINGFTTILNSRGNNLIFSTFCGGEINALARDRSGNFYTTGATSDSLFPVSPGAYDATYNAGPGPVHYTDAFISKFDFTDILSGIKALNKPQDFQITSVYPNPFNSLATIEFTIPVSGRITLSIYNILGQKIHDLAWGNMTLGKHIVQWDGKNDSGDTVSSGTYFVHLQMEENESSKGILFLK